MKIIIAPDSFKGSLTAVEVGATIKEAFAQEIPWAQVEVIPMADGGEGTLDALLYATKGKEVLVEATGPLGEQITCPCGVLGDGQTFVIEMAKVAGLPMVPAENRNPLKTTTYGLGECILHGIRLGFTRFIIGLGGSATNDGGLGMLQALGAHFYDENGQAVPPVAESLGSIRTVQLDTLDERLQACRFSIATDVTNPLCGPEGASHVFGPQKGASQEQVEQLDQQLARYARLLETERNARLQDVPGAGAAGGLGFAFLLLGGQLVSGARMIAEAAALQDRLSGADWIITGEGRSDAQTQYGKLPHYIAQEAKRHNAKAILLSASLGEGIDALYDDFVSLHSIAPGPITLEDSLRNGKQYLFRAARNIARLLGRG